MSKIIERIYEIDSNSSIHDTSQIIEIIKCEQLERIADALEKQTANMIISLPMEQMAEMI